MHLTLSPKMNSSRDKSEHLRYVGFPKIQEQLCGRCLYDFNVKEKVMLALTLVAMWKSLGCFTVSFTSNLSPIHCYLTTRNKPLPL